MTTLADAALCKIRAFAETIQRVRPRCAAVAGRRCSRAQAHAELDACGCGIAIAERMRALAGGAPGTEERAAACFLVRRSVVPSRRGSWGACGVRGVVSGERAKLKAIRPLAPWRLGLTNCYLWHCERLC
jgi:hypothetical protein